MRFAKTYLLIAGTLFLMAKANGQTVSCNGLNDWQPNQRYDVVGTIVYLNGNKYQSQFYVNPNISPDANSGALGSGKPWLLLGTCSQPITPNYVSCSAISVWNASTNYSQGQTVTYNGRSYSARWGNINNQPNLYEVWQIQGTCLVPSLIVSGTLNNFTSLIGAPSSSQTFVVSGTNLSANIVITTPDQFEVSLTSNGTFSSTLQLVPSNGSVNSTVYIRYNPSLPGTYSGNVVVSSTNLTSRNLAVTGIGTSIWQISGTNVYNNTGKVGIGTTTPNFTLDVNGTISGLSLKIGSGGTLGKILVSDALGFATWQNQPGSTWSTSGNNLYSLNNGNIGIGTSTPNHTLDVIGTISSSFLKLGSGGTAGKILISDAQGFATWQNQPADAWNTTGINTVLLNNGGNVGIGVSSPLAQLDVNGTSYFRQKVQIGSLRNLTGHSDAIVTVDGKLTCQRIISTVDNWADYVFSNEYKIMSLSEVEMFIKSNHHLPEIPSEKEVKANGIDLAEMNKLLLKKVEELTLYNIAMDKEIKVIQNELTLIKNILK